MNITTKLRQAFYKVTATYALSYLKHYSQNIDLKRQKYMKDWDFELIGNKEK